MKIPSRVVAVKYELYVFAFFASMKNNSQFLEPCPDMIGYIFHHPWTSELQQSGALIVDQVDEVLIQLLLEHLVLVHFHNRICRLIGSLQFPNFLHTIQFLLEPLPNLNYFPRLVTTPTTLDFTSSIVLYCT